MYRNKQFCEQSEKREEFQLALFTKFVTFDNPAVVRRSNDLLSQGNQFLIDYMFEFAATLLITKINSLFHLLGWYWPRKKALAMDKREIKKSFVPGYIVSECGVHIVDDHNYLCATSDWKQIEIKSLKLNTPSHTLNQQLTRQFWRNPKNLVYGYDGDNPPISNQCTALIEKMLLDCPHKRPILEDILDDPWMQGA